MTPVAFGGTVLRVADAWWDSAKSGVTMVTLWQMLANWAGLFVV